MPNITGGEWLRRRWESLGFSAASLARQSHVSRRTLSRLAAGEHVSPAVAAILARPLRLTPEALAALLRDGEVDSAEMGRLLGEPPPDVPPGPLLSLVLVLSTLAGGCG